MNSFYGYIRVSTAKQGERGVSLQEQRDAITRYAAKNSLTISRWFEERETAAKQGRRVFNEMLKLLRKRGAAGVVIHKIDRSARNLRDWADLGELIDNGIIIHFANESLDLNSRGGRLSADIQAVVAADYIRNLREEAKKGIYGRFKQGILPLPAPLGYLDCGAGKPKRIDPILGPLIKEAFARYSTGRHTLRSLLPELTQLGLSNRKGAPVSVDGLSGILNNPFYMGLIRVRRTGEYFQGVHEPLVSPFLFNSVQRLLRGNGQLKTKRHDFTYRQLLRCVACGYRLTGETQKGHVYYRCRCGGTSVREEVVESQIRASLQKLLLAPEEHSVVDRKVAELKHTWTSQSENHLAALRVQLSNIQNRLLKLTDAFLDGTIEKELFDERKRSLLFERQEVAAKITQIEEQPDGPARKVSEFFELASSALNMFDFALPPQKREVIEVTTANRTVSQKTVGVELRYPFAMLANRQPVGSGGPHHADLRTDGNMPASAFETLVDVIIEWFMTHANEYTPLVKGTNPGL